MFGKATAIATYLNNAFTVYQIRRFPSSKVPLFSINMTILLSMYVCNNMYWKLQTIKSSQIKNTNDTFNL